MPARVVQAQTAAVWQHGGSDTTHDPSIQAAAGQHVPAAAGAPKQQQQTMCPIGAMDLAKGLITELMPRYSNGAFMSQKNEKHRDKVSKWYGALRIIEAQCSTDGYQVGV